MSANSFKHDRYGFWLQEAGQIEPQPPLTGDIEADFVIVGGGFLGMWSAWHLKESRPDARIVILEAERCAHGPSGRNGGFVSSMWLYMDNLRQRFGDQAAIEIALASAEVVHEIDAWCKEQEVDARCRVVNEMFVSSAPVLDNTWQETVQACRDLGFGDRVTELDDDGVSARCNSPMFRSGVSVTDSANVDPARLAIGLRQRLLSKGVEIYEHSRVESFNDYAPGAKAAEGVVAKTDYGSVTAKAGILAINAAFTGLKQFRQRLTATSSHIVLTEPVPDVLEEINWTGGEAVANSRTLLHYMRTTQDNRILFGWGGGRIAYGSNLKGKTEIDRKVVDIIREDLIRHFPQLADRKITNAWGGPIDVSPTHIPFFGQVKDSSWYYGFGFTGNGVGPTKLGGHILNSLVLKNGDRYGQLALVNQKMPRVPPDPLRFIGGQLVRTAYIRKERLEAEERSVDPITRLVAALPYLLNVHLGRV